jgi:hypothetical protein
MGSIDGTVTEESSSRVSPNNTLESNGLSARGGSAITITVITITVITITVITITVITITITTSPPPPHHHHRHHHHRHHHPPPFRMIELDPRYCESLFLTFHIWLFVLSQGIRYLAFWEETAKRIMPGFFEMLVIIDLTGWKLGHARYMGYIKNLIDVTQVRE